MLSDIGSKNVLVKGCILFQHIQIFCLYKTFRIDYFNPYYNFTCVIKWLVFSGLGYFVCCPCLVLSPKSFILLYKWSVVVLPVGDNTNRWQKLKQCPISNTQHSISNLGNCLQTFTFYIEYSILDILFVEMQNSLIDIQYSKTNCEQGMLNFEHRSCKKVNRRTCKLVNKTRLVYHEGPPSKQHPTRVCFI